MLKRSQFWLGLLLGMFAAFRLRLPASKSLPLWDLVPDALVVCDSAGAVTKACNAASMLLGPDCTHFPVLRYPTGQAVPPGQHPLQRAASSRKPYSGRYCLTAANDSERLLDISARSLPDGGTCVLLRDVTVQQESEARQEAGQARQESVRTLCRRLNQAQTAEAIAQAVAEEVRSLLRSLPDIGVRLWVFDSQADMLTCLASAPDDRPIRPQSAAQSLPKTVRFDAQLPELWQLYVARKLFENSLPLLAGGVAIGHLCILSKTAVLEDPDQRGALEVIASLAALALAGPAASAQAASLAAQAAAMREITQAASGSGSHALADSVTAHVKRVVRADVCLLSVPIDGKLSALGQTFPDDLLHPKTAPDDPRLHGKAVQKVHRTHKSVVQAGIANPSFEAGPWRAFTGAGCHTLTALPLSSKRGVLAVYTQGASPLPDSQIKFLETLAAIVSLSLASASVQEDRAN